MITNDPTALTQELSELFSEPVSVDGMDQRQRDRTSVSVIRMSYTKTTGENNQRVSIRQTAIVLQDAELDLPHFTLAPRPRGVLNKVVSLLGSLGDLKFEDSPVFSEAYYLHGWVQPSVRALFTLQMRDYFAEHPGFNVIGKGHLLVVYKHNTICPAEQTESFVTDSLRIMELMQTAEEQLDTLPDVQRKTRASDVMASADQMDGIVGAMYRRQLMKHSFTPTQLQQFIASATPRSIPGGLKQQVLGNMLPLAVAGTLMCLAGIVAATLTGLFAQDQGRWIGILVAINLLLIGVPLVFFTMRHRMRKARILRHGQLASGTITNVEKTDTSINNQVRYHVSVSFKSPTTGAPQTAVCNAYSLSVDIARERHADQQPIKILIDPHESNQIVCLDLLMRLNG